MLTAATLLSLLGCLPRLVGLPFDNVLDAGLQFGFGFVLIAALIVLNYAFKYRWQRPTSHICPETGWCQVLLRMGASVLLAVGLAAGLSRLHMALTPITPKHDVLLLGYQVRAQFYVLLVALAQLFFDIFEQAQRVTLENGRLQREQLLARYEVLREQVNPHFLFNSLSTLSWLIRDQPAAAERFVEEMSQVYRYILQHSEQNQVPLRDELAFTLSYVHLLKIRFGESLHLQVELPASIDLLPVPPLALQTLVENAVKHNVVSQRQPLTIHLFLAAPNLLMVQNTLQLRLAPAPSSGLGLRNLANRLRYLYGAELGITQDTTSFTVQLPLLTA